MAPQKAMEGAVSPLWRKELQNTAGSLNIGILWEGTLTRMLQDRHFAFCLSILYYFPSRDLPSSPASALSTENAQGMKTIKYP